MRGDIEELLRRRIWESIELHQRLLQPPLLSSILKAIELVSTTLRRGGKVLIAGNGGSAADSQHMAAEIVGAFTDRDRSGLPAIALTTDSSILTALSNDYGYDEVFKKQLEALASPGDLFVAISTSGNSPNILRALLYAKSISVNTLALLGRDGGRAKGIADVEIIVPSDSTPRIQEVHELIIHLICEVIERELKELRRGAL